MAADEEYNKQKKDRGQFAENTAILFVVQVLMCIINLEDCFDLISMIFRTARETLPINGLLSSKYPAGKLLSS